MRDFAVFVDGDGQVAQFTTAEGAAGYINRHAGVLPKARVMAVHQRPVPCWVTKEGQVLKLEEIQDSHLTAIMHKIANSKLGATSDMSAALIQEAKRRMIAANPDVRLQLALERAKEAWPKLQAVREAADKARRAERQPAPDDRYERGFDDPRPRRCNMSLAELGREAWCVLDQGHPGECSLTRQKGIDEVEVERYAANLRKRQPKTEQKIEDENTRRLKALADELTGGGDK